MHLSTLFTGVLSSISLTHSLLLPLHTLFAAYPWHENLINLVPDETEKIVGEVGRTWMSRHADKGLEYAGLL